MIICEILIKNLIFGRKIVSMAEHNDLGRKAEDIAENFLKEKEYQILCRNYRYQKAEIDIIAKFENQIIIVEVKARSNNIFIEPQEAVDKRKIRLLTLAASQFMEENNIDLEIRFDIIAILFIKVNRLDIMHIESAFECIGGL